jgi:pimeloyl-ACP methyl ester carboxylesterase
MPEVFNQGVRISYDAVGEGDPLVLLHGWSCDRTWWEHSGYVEDLGIDHRILNIDQRGHGASDKPHEPSAYAQDLVVGDVLAVVDAERVERFAIWGLSYGGWVGFMTADGQPGRVTALITTGSWDPQPETFDDDNPFADEWDQAIRRGGMPELIATFQEEMGESYTSELPPWAEATTLEADPAALLAIHERALAGEGLATFDGFATPTLLIAGELDDPDDDASAAAGQLANGESLRLAGLGHGGSCASPSALPPAREFLERWPA